MRHLWIAALGVTAACGSKEGAGSAIAHRAEAGDVAIVGGTVVPMDREGALTGHTVLVRGETIVAVAPAGTVDVTKATVLDASGQWVMPGLADMHVHLWSKDDLSLFLLNGVTTVRNLFGSPEHVRWRDAIAKGELAGPTLINAGPIIDGEPPTWPGSAVVTTAEAARKTVNEQKQAGYEWLKVYNSVNEEAYAAILDEAKKVGMPVGGHVPRAVGIDKVIGAGQVTIEHLDGYVPFFGDPPAPGPLVEASVKAGVWNCPTLVVTDRFGMMDKPEQLAGTRGLELVSAMARAAWDPKNDFRLRTFTPEKFEAVRQRNQLRRELVLALSKAGGKLVLGTDTGNPYVVPGFAVVEELRLLTAAGLTPAQALRMATAAAGELQGKPGALGVLAAGARADVIVVGKDPLAAAANVADPSIVMVRGKVHRRDELLAIARKRPPSPAEKLAAMPALPDEGEVIASAQYEVRFHDQVIGAERVAFMRLADKGVAIHGQALYVAPQASQMTYRSRPDVLAFTTDAVDPPKVVVKLEGGKAVATQEGKPPIELAAAPGAVLAPQTVAEFIWYAQDLRDKPRTFTAVEVITEGALRLDPGTYTFTPTAPGHYDVVGKVGALDVTGTFIVGADVMPEEVKLTFKFGTLIMRRVAGQ
jgi:imidazolonepropionase-like amidohydrolase